MSRRFSRVLPGIRMAESYAASSSPSSWNACSTAKTTMSKPTISILLAARTYAGQGSTELARALRRRGAAIAKRFLEFNPGDTRALYNGCE